MKPDLANVPTHCTICTTAIPEERATRNSNTCQKECAKMAKAIRRARSERRKCRHCGKPSTPEERKAFAAWRRSHPEFKPARRGRPAKVAEEVTA